MGWLTKLLCRIGFHVWVYGYQNILLEDGTIHKGYQTKLCKHCPTRETGLYEQGWSKIQWYRHNQ